MTRVILTGPYLVGALTFDNVEVDTIIGHPDNRTAVLLTVEQTTRLLCKWVKAGAAERCFRYLERGLFLTRDHTGEASEFRCWESATGSDGTDLYSTANAPIPLIVREPLPGRRAARGEGDGAALRRGACQSFCLSGHFTIVRSRACRSGLSRHILTPPPGRGFGIPRSLHSRPVHSPSLRLPDRQKTR